MARARTKTRVRAARARAKLSKTKDRTSWEMSGESVAILDMAISKQIILLVFNSTPCDLHIIYFGKHYYCQ